MLLDCFLLKGYKNLDNKEILAIQQEYTKVGFPDDDEILDFITLHELDRLEIVKSYRAV